MKVIKIAVEASNDEQFKEVCELHTCPYKMDIYDDHESLCDCDADQEYECAMDI